MTQNTSKGLRLHIGIYGKRNVGKSSILNAVTRQQVSIVSCCAGTTTDPVEKPMELLPLGPVLFIDTAGIDDTGEIGSLRAQRTRMCLDRTDIALLVTAGQEWGMYEETIITECEKRSVPFIIVYNKIDVNPPLPQYIEILTKKKYTVIQTSTVTDEGMAALRNALVDKAPQQHLSSQSLVGDIVGSDETAVLVVPIDKEAPKGRLILPQVQTIRDILDSDAHCVVCKEYALRNTLTRLTQPPKIVITDSQAFSSVAAHTPDSVLMTSFSILFARHKGDLASLVEGACAIDSLKKGDRVLIAEACTHHPISDDIGRVKIPRWLTEYTAKDLVFKTCQGHDFPDSLRRFSLVIHCGACMHNRREMLNRIMYCRENGVPITNYGLAIAYTLGIFERALQPFPAALERYKHIRRHPKHDTAMTYQTDSLFI